MMIYCLDQINLCGFCLLRVQEKLFPTENNFVNAFAQLDAEISQSKSATGSNWNVEVTEMNKESLCFEVALTH